MTAREASVRRAVLTYLRTLGPGVCYRSNPATPYGVTGDPDLMVCVGGQLLCIELKRPGWRPTPGWEASPQGRRLRAWATAGAVAVAVTSRADLEQVMERVMRPVLQVETLPGKEDVMGNRLLYDYFRSEPPYPTRRVRRPKRWGILEVIDECHECRRRTYRLVWPWTVTYDERMDWPLRRRSDS